MRGSNNLQRTLQVLTQRHGVTLDQPRRVPLIPPPAHDSIIIEGIASTSDIDIDRVSFAPFCFGTSLPTVPLLLEHDTARPAGQVTPTYDSAGTLHIRTTVTGTAARYGAFSIAVRNIQYDIHNADSRHFHATVTTAELTEISLTEYPHLPTAIVATRMRPSAQAEFYGAAQQYFAKLAEIITLLKEVQHVAPNR